MSIPNMMVEPSPKGRVPACWRRRNSAPETRAEAPPPNPLKRPTISGMAVIFTVRAATAPMREPMMIPSDDPGPGKGLVLDQGHDDGDEHGDGGHDVSPSGRSRRGKLLEADDEEERREEVGQLLNQVSLKVPRSCVRSHGKIRKRHRRAYFFLNISSMRSVTMKPPTTLMVAKMIEISPRMTMTGSLAIWC